MMARVFVVDDDAAVLNVVGRFLERDGHDVRPFACGASALQAARKEPPDAVLSDIYMPGGDGIELLLAFIDRTPTVPVIAMSGGGCFPSTLGLEDAARLGAVDTLEKPISPARLKEAIGRALDQDKASGEGTEAWNR